MAGNASLREVGTLKLVASICVRFWRQSAKLTTVASLPSPLSKQVDINAAKPRFGSKANVLRRETHVRFGSKAEIGLRAGLALRLFIQCATGMSEVQKGSLLLLRF
jgi:hypothetical protein